MEKIGQRGRKLTIGGLDWYFFDHIDKKDLALVGDKFGFHKLDLSDCLAPTERPKVDVYDDYLFLVLQFPERNKETGSVKVSEIDIFLGKNYIVTFNRGNRQLNKLFEKLKSDPKLAEEYTNDGVGVFFYRIIKFIWEESLPFLDSLSDKIHHLEREIFEEGEPGTISRVKEIAAIKKDLIIFQTIIEPQRIHYQNLGQKQGKLTGSELVKYFADLISLIESMNVSIIHHRHLLDVIEDANETVISNNTNEVIKTLTIFSVFMLPLTLVSGIYGMNIALPLANHPWAFLVVVGLMVAVILAMVIYFKRKNLL
jgi:magnesium transporter